MKLKKRRLFSWLVIAAFMLSLVNPLAFEQTIRAAEPPGNGGAIENLFVEADNPFFSSLSTYTFSFTIGETGTLGTEDSLHLVFPDNFDLGYLQSYYDYMQGDYVDAFLGDYLDVFVDEALQEEVTFPLGLFYDYHNERYEIVISNCNFPAYSSVTIVINVIDDWRGIYNPWIPGFYNIFVYTEADEIHYGFEIEIKDYSDITTLGDVPVGMNIIDSSSLWEYREEANYEPGAWDMRASLLWTKVEMNDDSGVSTLLSDFPIALFNFDENDNNDWADSGAGLNNLGLRKFLNGTSYTGNDDDYYEVTFYDAFSDGFRNTIIPGPTGDMVYLPTVEKLGGEIPEDAWSYFKDKDPWYRSVYSSGLSMGQGELLEEDDEGQVSGISPQSGYHGGYDFYIPYPITDNYWTATPAEGELDFMLLCVNDYGDFYEEFADNPYIGVRPAVDINPDLPVIWQRDFECDGFFVVNIPHFSDSFIDPPSEFVVGDSPGENIQITLFTSFIPDGSLVTAKLIQDETVLSQSSVTKTSFLKSKGLAYLELPVFVDDSFLPAGLYNLEVEVPAAGLKETFPYEISIFDIDDLIDNQGWIPIANAEELYQISLSNEGNPMIFGAGYPDWEGLYEGGMDKKYIIVDDIDLSGFGEGSWLPIGSDSYYGYEMFEGTLNGNGKIISGLNIDEVLDYNGLFTILGVESVIRNLSLTDVNIEGDYNAGALAGINDGYISNVNVLNVEDKINTITGNDYIGGLVGENYGRISNSSADVSLSGFSMIGGLVGQNNALVINSQSTADIFYNGNINHSDIGGLVGNNNGFLTKSSSSGTVNGSYNVGGLIGKNSYFGFVFDCKAEDVIVEGDFYVGGLIGCNYADTFDSMATGFVFGIEEVGVLIGRNEAAVYNSTSSGITEGEHFVGGLIGKSNFYGSVFYCEADGEVAGYEGIGGLIGSNESDVYNCQSNAVVLGYEDVGGLIGSNSGDIFNSTAMGDVFSESYAGGLIGYMGSGIIDGCYATGDVTAETDEYGWGGNYVGGLVGLIYNGSVTNSHADGNIQGIYFLGGLIGSSNHTVIENCSANGDVISVWDETTNYGYNVGGLAGETYLSSISNSYSHGSAEAYYQIGGLVGLNIETDITDCYSEGESVAGDYSIGGLVGENIDGKIFNSYADVNVSGNHSLGGLIGYNLRGDIFESHALGNISGESYVGGLVGGVYDGSITGSSAEGDVIATGSHAGGMAGYSGQSDITDSFASGTVNNNYDESIYESGHYYGGLAGYFDDGSIFNSFSTSSVTGLHYVGGLAGYIENNVFVENSFATVGSVTGEYYVGGLAGESLGTIKNSYATGLVDGTYNFNGGLVAVGSGTITSSYFDSETTLQEDNGRGEPRTTAQLQNATADTSYEGHQFTGWSNEVWEFTPKTEYPQLLWFLQEDPASTFNVIYHDNGADYGTVPIDEIFYETGETVIVLDNIGNLFREGYTFSGWNTMADGSGISYNVSDTFEMGNHNVTLYAVWAINSYTVTFIDWNDNILKTDTVIHGANAAPPTDPTRTGYSFTGWYPSGFTGITDNMTVTAQYSINSYTLNYLAGEGGSITGQTVQTINYGSDGTEVIALPDAGFIFSGWNDGYTNSTRIDIFVTGNLSVTAYFEPEVTLPERAPITGFYVLQEDVNLYIDILSYVENIQGARNAVQENPPSSVLLVHQDGRATTLENVSFSEFTETTFSFFLEQNYYSIPDGSEFRLSLNGSFYPVAGNDVMEQVYMICGDVNGDGELTVTDAIMVLRHIVGLAPLSAVELQRVTESSESVTVKDAITILRRVVGLQDKTFKLAPA